MAHLTIAQLERHLSDLSKWKAEGRPSTPEYAYCETGRYKPYAMATINAAKRRGYRVRCVCPGVFYVFPKDGQTAG